MTAKALQAQTFLWEGINKRGERIKGELSASTMAIVKADLRKQGIVAKRVRKKTRSIFAAHKRRITHKDISIFSRQMSTMINAGIPLVQSFEIIGRGHEKQTMQDLINKIKEDVESGTTFADALAKFPTHFNELYVNLIGAGEQSGSLDLMLDKVATYQEKIESIKGKIKKALFYPTAVIVVALIVTSALLIFVVPQFETLFKGFGADLPSLTRMVIDVSEFCQAYWYIILGITVAAVVGFVEGKKRSPKFAHFLDRASLKLPIIGPIL